MKETQGPIGVFDSGYGGLTILDGIRRRLPQYDYLYVADNARAPYGSRSFDVVYEFTKQAVMKMFAMGCHLIILGCNTASAKALRTIQQTDIPATYPDRRVLGVIRPTTEIIGKLTKSRHVGLVATEGTVRSESYNIEIAKMYPDITLTSMACPLWVPIIENNEAQGDGADYFVKKRIASLMEKDPKIDTIILGCTHYPLLLPKIKKYTPQGVQIIEQGGYVAASLEDYLQRHPDMQQKCSTGGHTEYYTTENPEKFKETATIFLKEDINAKHINLESI